jgi:hypothetical protein
MLGALFGQFVGGVIWGVGATLAASVMRDGNADGLRDITKIAVKTYLTAADRLQATAEEVRHNVEALIAEVEAERATDTNAGHPAA